MSDFLIQKKEKKKKMYLFSQSKVRPNINDDTRLIKSSKQDEFYITVNGENVGDVLGFESDATNCYTLEEVLYKMLPNEVTAQIVTEDEHNRHVDFLMLSIEIDDQKLCELIEEEEIRKKKEEQISKMNGLLEVRRLLDEENIVTGYGEDCTHSAFKHTMRFYPCPWDSRVLNGGEGSVDCGCYYRCSKRNDKILANKDVYLRAIDRLIGFLEENPTWGQQFDETKREPILDSIDSSQLKLWDKQKEKRDNERYKEEELYRKENEVEMIGCPPEFIQDLKKLHDSSALDELGEDYIFLEDKIIYKYFDMYDGIEENIEITTESIWFSMLPDKSNSTMSLEIGTGCVCRHTLSLDENNKEKILEFWSKWKKFKQENPDLYTYESKKHYSLSEDERNALIDLMNGDGLNANKIDYIGGNYPPEYVNGHLCDACLFESQCDRLNCLRDM